MAPSTPAHPAYNETSKTEAGVGHVLGMPLLGAGKILSRFATVNTALLSLWAVRGHQSGTEAVFVLQGWGKLVPKWWIKVGFRPEGVFLCFLNQSFPGTMKTVISWDLLIDDYSHLHLTLLAHSFPPHTLSMLIDFIVCQARQGRAITFMS